VPRPGLESAGSPRRRALVVSHALIGGSGDVAGLDGVAEGWTEMRVQMRVLPISVVLAAYGSGSGGPVLSQNGIARLISDHGLQRAGDHHEAS